MNMKCPGWFCCRGLNLSSHNTERKHTINGCLFLFCVFLCRSRWKSSLYGPVVSSHCTALRNGLWSLQKCPFVIVMVLVKAVLTVRPSPVRALVQVTSVKSFWMTFPFTEHRQGWWQSAQTQHCSPWEKKHFAFACGDCHWEIPLTVCGLKYSVSVRCLTVHP